MRMPRVAAATLLLSAGLSLADTRAASADGYCSPTTNYMNAHSSGVGSMQFGFGFSTSNKIIGYDVHQNGGDYNLLETAHWYTVSGSTVFDWINVTMDPQSSWTTIQAWGSVQYC